ncbi:glycosyl hydrolase family 18 protein [Dehalobacter sp.]|uniref:glycosyl hydrolase family 18 protein n=1 Tax=Dehalobacter sp. TaxID=1962289 RepID=UPI002584DEB9|nr:glycosyl hydrolase family 18 protein [Dehalobacter sp.]MCG1024459.1 LysM peptidoglycan-binding domain-containing protein [Dehalobacter sp.]
MKIHVVSSGQSIYSIARKYGVSPQKMIADNELTNPNQLVVGQTLVILESSGTHTVAAGESLYLIAQKHGVTVNALLAAANPRIIDPSRIYAGQTIAIPAAAASYGTIEVNGYAFPNINRDILRKSLRHLTYLSIFSYQVNADGTLNTIPDEPLIQAAREARTAPLMVITNIQQGGSFNSTLARSILTNQTAQNTLISQVIRTLREKNYYGLDIDFEYIYPSDRENYNNFLRRIVNTLRPLGYPVTTALAPKLTADQKGLLYEAHDYPVHGALANHVILMTYEWGYTYSPPKAVAPVNEVRKVLTYAVSAIPRQKIFMGIPNYGYDWTLPYVSGTAARTVSNSGAVDLARTEKTAIQYDSTAQSPYFTYYDDAGKKHEVWFEDARSIYAKLTLAKEFRVGGISYWTIGRYFPQNWLVLRSLYSIKKLL